MGLPSRAVNGWRVWQGHVGEYVSKKKGYVAIAPTVILLGKEAKIFSGLVAVSTFIDTIGIIIILSYIHPSFFFLFVFFFWSVFLYKGVVQGLVVK